jgi:hypothetical protein
MSVSQKWRSLAAGLFLSIATVGAVSTVASTPSQAADVGFGIFVNDRDHGRDGRYWEHRREEAWRRDHYWRGHYWRDHYWRERERARWEHRAWREHERRWDDRYDHRW